MATAGDGATPYQSGGAGGKFRKKPIQRCAWATPYSRPRTTLRNNSPSLLAKLVDPASRLIYAGVDRLFGVFRKRLAAPRPPETGEEAEASSDKGGNLGSITEMLKHKTFSRSEIEQLTALLYAKIANSDGDEASPSLRVEASSTSKDVEEREKEDNIHAISTPVVTSRAFEEERAPMNTTTPITDIATLFPTFGKNAPFFFSASAAQSSSGFKPNTSTPDAKKPLIPCSTSLFKENNQVFQSKKEDNINANAFKSTPSTFATISPLPPSSTTASSLPPSTTIPSGVPIFGFGGTTPTPLPFFSSISGSFFLFGSSAPPTTLVLKQNHLLSLQLQHPVLRGQHHHLFFHLFLFPCFHSLPSQPHPQPQPTAAEASPNNNNNNDEKTTTWPKNLQTINASVQPPATIHGSVPGRCSESDQGFQSLKQQHQKQVTK